LNLVETVKGYADNFKEVKFFEAPAA